MTETTETKAITQYRPLTPSVWQMIEMVAPTIWRAGLFGIGSAEAAAAIMLKGHELGLGLAASFEFIHIINGKPALSPRGTLAMIQDSKELAELEVKDFADDKGPTRCRVRMKRTNGFEYTVEFSMKDAERAGLLRNQSGWDKYPANMLRWRAIGFCADVVFPDVIGGMKHVDDANAEITEDGDVIDTQDWNVVEVIQSDNNREHIDPAILIHLTTQYDPAKILEANEGKIPETEAEIRAVLEKLGGKDERAR